MLTNKKISVMICLSTRKQGDMRMSEKEQKIMETIADALPKMSDMKKGEFLGYAKAMADLKKEDRKNSSNSNAEKAK